MRTRKTGIQYFWDGKWRTIPELMKLYPFEIKHNTMAYRLEHWTIEKALSTPIRANIHQPNKNTEDVDLEKFKWDPDLELKRRIERYQSANMSGEEILLREKAY